MRRRVPFLDLSQIPTILKSALKRKFSEMLEVGVYSGGKELTDLEKKLEEITGSAHVVPCSNGTDALEVALRALEIGIGDEVLVPALTWVSTAEAVCAVGAKPVFIDTMDDGLIDMNQLDPFLTENTKAVIPVHLYGKMVDMQRLSEWAKSHQLLIIEDAAQALGSKILGKSAGTWGDIGCLSFYPTKNLGALGEAGALLTQDQTLAERIRVIINHGQVEKGNHVELGRNARMDSLQAGFLNVKLSFFDRWQVKRKTIAKIYLDSFSDLDLALPSDILEPHHNAHLFVIQTENRDEIAIELEKHGIGTAVHYSQILPRMKPFYNSNNYPVAESLTGRILSLPLNPWMSLADINAVIRSVRIVYSTTS